MRNRIIHLVFSSILLLVSAAACDLIQEDNGNANGPIQGSGTVETTKVNISPEMGGRVADVLVGEGDQVGVGDPLFRLEGDMLQAQRNQAQAALNTARANLEVARSSLESAEVALDSARIQYDIELNAARAEYQPVRRQAWTQDQPDEFDLPVWYFGKYEEMSAAQGEIQIAQDELSAERQRFEDVLRDIGGSEFLEAEERLIQAQTAFSIAQDIVERARGGDNDQLLDEAETDFDIAESELEAAQTAYENLLSEDDSQSVLEARANLALVEERYHTALDRYNQYLSGEDSLRVRAADIAVRSAQANLESARAQVSQTEAAVEQAQTQLDLIDVQMDKLIIYAPVEGIVISRLIQPGEVLQPGASALTLGQLDDLTITVYIPEDRYGQINLGMSATVEVDSFPGDTFHAEVMRIADEAEFTPRNVQTEEGRRTTVFAIELSVSDPAGRLKPGMPADVTFEE